MGAIWATALPKYLDKWGVPYRLVPGWEKRSRSSGGFESLRLIGIHHTADGGASVASSLAWQYTNSPNRPIGNGLLDRNGVFHFGCAGASNTQGMGGPWWSPRGTVPLNDGNRHTFSIEASNKGTGEPWGTTQQNNYVKLCAAIIDWANNETPGANIGPGQIISHFEWAPSRKNDPFGPSRWAGMAMWNMNAFRGEVLALMNGGVITPTPPPPTGGSVDWASGNFGLWPLNNSKPTIRLNSYGEAVKYAQAVLKHKKGYAITIDGDFGSQTEKFVRQFQSEHNLTVDGWIGSQGWAAIDKLAGVTTTTPTPPTPPPTTSVSYTVRSGDTLAKIASLYKTTVQAIATANKITDVNSIRVGQVLTIPTGTTTTTPPPPTSTFDPANGHYGLWPLNKDKPSIRSGSTGDAVKYAQGVLKREAYKVMYKMGKGEATTACQGLAVDGQFGSQTDRCVRLVQSALDLTVDGIIGRAEMWPFIDNVSDGQLF